MAAYAALVSVLHIIDQIHHHPRPPIYLHKEHVEALTSNVTFLQEFLEGYNPHVSYSAEADPLESRIAEAAYAAEDVIESYIVDQILSRSSDHAEEISSTEFNESLQKVIEEMDLIKMEVAEMKEKKMGVQIKRSLTNAGSFRSSSTAQKVAMVGFDDVLYEMMDKITGGGIGRQIIPIVGMGGLDLFFSLFFVALSCHISLSRSSAYNLSFSYCLLFSSDDAPANFALVGTAVVEEAPALAPAFSTGVGTPSFVVGRVLAVASRIYGQDVRF